MSRPSRILSQQVKVCINKLYKQQSSKWISLIRRSGEIAAIPYVTPFLESTDSELQTAAENTISDLLQYCPPSELVWLSEKMREHLPHGYMENADQWVHLTTERIEQWSMDVHPIKIIMASFHWNGYVRAAALKRMTAFRDGSELPFLLIRMNDWVSPIRFQTYKALKQRIHPHNAAHFIQHIALVKRLEQCGRDRYEALTESIYQLLRQPDCLPELNLGMLSNDRFIRRFCLQMALESSAAIPGEILKQAAQDRDPAIRVWAVRKAGQMLSGEGLKQLLLVMVHDAFPVIRREALELLAYQFSKEAVPFLQTGLLDRNAIVREIARKHLSKIQSVSSYAEFYLDTIWSGNDRLLSAALYGLGETGQAEDAEIIAEYIGYPAVHIRKAVIRGLARLDAKLYSQQIREALQDNQPGVSREAAQALQKHSYLLDKNELMRIIKESTMEHVQRNSLRLLPSIGGWDQLEGLLEVLVDTRNQLIQREVHYQLNSWIHRSERTFRGRPSAEQADNLLNKLESCQRKIHPQHVHLLRWLLTL